MKQIKRHNQFEKDLKKLINSSYKLEPLKELIILLEEGKKLPSKYKAHELKGDFKGIWDCHIKNNWLLLYIPDDSTVILLRTGTHSDLLGL